jgi:outer membrane protein assembly factor BamB
MTGHGRCAAGLGTMALGVVLLTARTASADGIGWSDLRLAPFAPLVSFLQLEVVEHEAPPKAPLEVAQQRRGRRNRAGQAGSLVLQEDRELRQQLDRAQTLIDSGRHGEAARLLGTLLARDDGYDFFLTLQTPQGPHRRGFKSHVADLIGQLSPAGREAYELQFGGEARRLLEAAVQRGSELGLQEVVARFFHTRAGYEAAFLLARHALDRNQPRAAADLLEQLHRTPGAAAPLEPHASLLAAVCAVRLGDDSALGDALRRLGQLPAPITFQLAGTTTVTWPDDPEQQRRVLELLVGSHASSSTASSGGDWITYRGNPARNAHVACGVPVLAALWRTPLGDTRQAVEGEQQRQRLLETGQAALVAVHPVAVGSWLLCATPGGLQVRDLADGRLLWTYPSHDTGGATSQFLWNAGVHGCVATDGRRAFLVQRSGNAAHDAGHSEELGLQAGLGGNAQPIAVVQAKMIWGGPMAPQAMWAEEEPGGQGSLSNQLLAIDLATQGKRVWRCGGITGGSDARLAGAYFLGPPLVYGDRLYVLAEFAGALRLLVLYPDTGRLDWGLELGLVEQSISEDTYRRQAGATPSIAAGVVVCPTSTGGVVAVDLTRRSLLWAYEYARRHDTRSSFEHGQFSMLRYENRWRDGVVTLGDDCALLTPLESDELHCVDLRTGELRWRAPRGEQQFVACIQGGNALVVGKHHVVALRLQDGKPAWPQPLLLPGGATPSGRGLATAGEYYLPTSNASLLQIDTTSGSLLAEHRSPREIALGNLIWHRGRLISLGAQYLEAYEERDAALQRLEALGSAEPDRAEVLARSAEVQAAVGHLDAALGAALRAYELSPQPATRNVLVRLLLDAVRRGGADAPRWQQLLDELAASPR